MEDGCDAGTLRVVSSPGDVSDVREPSRVTPNVTPATASAVPMPSATSRERAAGAVLATDTPFEADSVVIGDAGADGCTLIVAERSGRALTVGTDGGATGVGTADTGIASRLGELLGERLGWLPATMGDQNIAAACCAFA